MTHVILTLLGLIFLPSIRSKYKTKPIILNSIEEEGVKKYISALFDGIASKVFFIVGCVLLYHNFIPAMQWF